MKAGQKNSGYAGFFLRMFLLAVLLPGLLMAEPTTNPEASSKQNSEANPETNYVGSAVCQSCHASEYARWKSSHHAHALGAATAANMPQGCEQPELVFHGIRTRFFTREGACFVNTQGASGEYADFRILYTLGYYPLQQYLVELGQGHIQALNVAWDSRTAAEGGQRWFHLQPDEDISPDHPFFWTRHYQNWNSRCAQCHVTGFEKNYREQEHSYASAWAENAVTCESCHGPASQHLQVMMSGAGLNGASLAVNGFTNSLPKAGVFEFVDARPIARPVDTAEKAAVASSTLLNQCGSCHSRREAFADVEPNADYFETHRLSLLEPGLYFADGQIQDEVFVMGSFLQSRMHAAGVNCLNCHDVHGGETLIKGNGLCLQCHRADSFDVPEHHHHEAGSTGSQCVECHMPSRTYMQVDDRRDHRFVVPKPVSLSVAEAMPSPCTSCHADKSREWVNEQLKIWDVAPLPASHWSVVNARLQNFDAAAASLLPSLIGNMQLPAMMRASLLIYLPEAADAVTPSLLSFIAADSSPLLRSEGVQTLLAFEEITDSTAHWQRLLQDESAVVRYQAALHRPLNGETGEPEPLPADNLRELQQQLAYNADSPAGQSRLAAFYLGEGAYDRAEQAFLKALEIEPQFLPARLNYADFLRAAGRESEAGEQLHQAVALAADSGAAHHSLGLYLVRQKLYPQALQHLAQSILQADANPRYAYVYAVALAKLKNHDEAIASLQLALERWPSSRQLLSVMILYLEQEGRLMEAMAYRKRLDRLAIPE